ncbi:cell wall hydrolase [Anaerosacchariphilus sp. NSJ-68]|uniref:Cell wall hydrolase n=2 Tax=Lachnospiraceae TaxID=186803 RepID=A0A923LEM0_9FIRM|nr:MULTISPECIES: cell wall hydrolase [Lachnospiraceae]MBC5660868.1 cell wall hydrolase [Anaerosacchariphilus hominis]
MKQHSLQMKMAYRLGAAALALSLGFTSYAVPDQSDVDDIQNEIDKAQDEIDKTKNEIDATQDKKDKLEQAKGQMESYLKDLNRQYSSLEDQITELNQQIQDKKAEIEQTQAELEEAKATEEKQYADMKARIQYMYENPRSSFVEILLESGSFAGALNRADYAERITAYDRDMLESYAAHKAEIQEKEEKLEAEKAALDEMQASLEKKQGEVSALASSTSGKISQHVSDIAAAQADLDGKSNTLANQQEVLKQLIAEKKKIEAQIEAAKAAEIIGSLGDVTGVRTTELEYVQYGAYGASDDEVKALATLIYCEAGNQGAEGQLAVGAVVMNRIRDPRFAQGDIMSVIRAPKQFSPVTSGRFDLMLTDGADSVTESCYNAARRAIAGESNVGNRTFFRTYANYPALSGLVIGAHIFSYTWNYSS